MAQGISTQKPPCIMNSGVMANGCKNVEEFTINLIGTAHTVRRDDGKTHARSNVEKLRIPGLLFPFEVTLEFNENIIAPVDGGEAINYFEGTNVTFATKRRCEWPFFSTSKTNQAG